MSLYAIPLMSAFFVFAVIAFLGTVPWTVYQYRKHGYFSFWRNVIIFSFIYYCLTAFFLVSLPLLAERNNPAVYSPDVLMQLKPFNMFHNFKEVKGFVPSHLRTYPTLFKSFTFLEVFFNIALLLPLGVYLRYFLKSSKKWWIALLLVFSTTLFFEVSQRTALFGYYANPYRLFDVDDLITNTLGGMIGFFIAPILLHLIPTRDDLKEKDLQYDVDHQASYGAQLIEVFVSLMIARFVGSIFSMIFLKSHYLFMSNLLWIFIFIVIFPVMFKGKTIGGKVVKIKFATGEKTLLWPLTYRFILINLPSVVSHITQKLNEMSSENVYLLSSQIMFFLLMSVIWCGFWFVLIRDWAKKKNEPFFNRMISADMIRYKKGA